ncbi:hypothetical protein ACFLV0_01200 [Chloroflexota bacterium]
MPDLQIVEYPGAIENHSSTEIKEHLGKIFDSIVGGLTKVAPSSGESLGQESKNQREIVRRGIFSEINDFFYDNKWTDGLPIVPPTIEAVEEMLSWTDLPADKEIATLQIANLRATPRNIAVNGVMAGCRPEYMPLLVAAVEAIGDPLYQLRDIGSTASIKPFLLVNGPIIKQLDIYYGTSVMCPVRRVNSTVGRALGLIVRNIAGFREGEGWLGCFGLPGTPFVIAEDEDRSPWNPYHVDRGFQRSTSTVTAMAWMNLSYQLLTTGVKAEPHLNGISYYMGKATGATTLNFQEHQSFVILISPSNAQIIARDGYSREDVKQYITENARLTVGEIDEELRFCLTGSHTVHSYVEEGKWPKSLDLRPDEMISFILSPELLHVVVCGGHERNRNLIIRAYNVTPVTKEIKLPARWNIGK